MLKKYKITNFKSFIETTEFDLEKTNYQILSDINVANDILKGMLYVGANASGKSNSILAIKFLLDCLLGKSEINFDHYLCLYSVNPIMTLEYSFSIDNTDIMYTISYQKIDKIINETLITNGQKILERNGSVAKVNITENNNYSDIPKDILFLREIYFNTKFRGNTVLQHWFEYLSNSIYIDLFYRETTQYGNLELSIKNYLDENGTNEINNFFSNYGFNQTIEYTKTSIGNLITVDSKNVQIFFKRKGINEPIPLILESLGNQTLLELLPPFFHIIKNNGMLLLDEFSSGFHNDLEELLIKYFMYKSKDSQVLFVSHSTNLLTNKILRPDQIYSIYFDENGSHTKRFSSEKPREAQNLEKMYLGGVFNGIPNYKSEIN